MLNYFIKSYKKLIEELSKSQMDNIIPESSESSDSLEQQLEPEEDLKDACAKFVILFREDGEFTIGSDFFRYDDEAIEISGMMLHMINSGTLAEYFIQSLKAWAEGHIEKEAFAKEVVKEWKKTFDDNVEQDLSSGQNKLAIDPSDVFGLKRMK